MKKQRCKTKKCRCLFVINPKHPDQKYCSKDKCQKVRKARRQRRKIDSDEVYRKGQEDCQEKWKTENPDYWKKYRKKNPQYTQQNREKQKERDRLKKALKGENTVSSNLAKMHPLKHHNSIISGIYKLIPVKPKNLAKMHPLIIEINEITEGYNPVS